MVSYWLAKSGFFSLTLLGELLRLLGDFCVMRATVFSGAFEEILDAIIELLYDFYYTFDL